MRISDWSSDVCSSYLHLAIQCIVGAKRDFAFLSQPLGEPEGQRTGCRAGRVDVGKDEIAAEMPLGKACTGSNRQPGRQIVGRAELIDVVIPPAESCLLAEGLDAAPIGPAEVEPDGQSPVRLDPDYRAKPFGLTYFSAPPGHTIIAHPLDT